MSVINTESTKFKWAITITSIILTGIVTYFVTLAIAVNSPPTEVIGQLTVDLVLKEMQENPDFQEEVLAEIGAVSKDIEVAPPIIEPDKQDINIFFDGSPVQQNQPAYISEGSIYIDMYDIGKVLDKSINWDGSSNSVYIGVMPDESNYFDDILQSYQTEGLGGAYWQMDISKGECITIAGIKYYHGITNSTSNWIANINERRGKGFYNLDAKYSQLSGKFGPRDGAMDESIKINFYGDGNLVQTLEFSKGDMPKDFSIDLTSILQLKIELIGDGASLVNWKVK